MDNLKELDPEIFKALKQELIRQQEGIELIASENYASLNVMKLQGSIFTNKYAEGYPGKRYYEGCENMDIVENLAIERAKKLFGAQHVNVQPHSGTQANMAVLMAVLSPGDTILSMDLAHGGHLSHGHKKNFAGMYFNVVSYTVDPKTEMLNYDNILKLAIEHKPRLIIAGASAYPRIIDFSKFREIADKVGAILLADIAHIAGLVAVGLHPTSIPYAHFTTTTTHKTLRGPRGGMIMCNEEYAKVINSRIFPGIQGGPLMHVIAAKAVCLKEALTKEFRKYQEQIINNCKTMVEEFKYYGYRIVSGGSDNHLFLVDLREKGLTGAQASSALQKANITVNMNLIPFDPLPATKTSGIRIGTPAITTRGMKECEMKLIVKLIDKVLKSIDNEDVIKKTKEEVKELCKQFPVYPLDLYE